MKVRKRIARWLRLLAGKVDLDERIGLLNVDGVVTEMPLERAIQLNEQIAEWNSKIEHLPVLQRSAIFSMRLQ